MSEIEKPAFPQTPDGVTDWEKVFEDPDRGILKLIRDAHSREALRACVLVVIEKLFTRKNDQLEIARLKKQLDGILEEAGDGVPTDEVVALLREVKGHREQRARDYLKEKETKARERRGDGAWKRWENRLYILINDQRYFYGILGVLLFLTVGVLGALATFQHGDKRKSTAKKAEETVVAHTPPVDETPRQPEKVEEAHVPPPAKKRPPKKKFPPMVVFRYLPLPLAPDGTPNAIKLVLPVAVLESEDGLSSLCRIQPIIVDMLNNHFSRVFAGRSEASANDLKRVAGWIADAINTRLKSRVVRRFRLVKFESLKVRPPEQCTLAPEQLQARLR